MIGNLDRRGSQANPDRRPLIARRSIRRHHHLRKPRKGSDLKSWALQVAKRSGPKKARVALARKLAVVLHRMLKDGTEFVAHRQVAPAMAA